MSVNKTHLVIAVILLSFNLNSNSQSIRRDLSEADLDWNWPKDSAQRIAYCVGIFDLASMSSDNPAGASMVRKNGDVAFRKVIESKKLNENELNSFAEKGFKRGQFIASKIMGEFDSLNEQIRDMQAKEVLKQVVTALHGAESKYSL